MNLLLVLETVIPLFVMSCFIVLIAVRFLPAEASNIEEN
jgi:hypothetical protein